MGFLNWLARLFSGQGESPLTPKPEPPIDAQAMLARLGVRASVTTVTNNYLGNDLRYPALVLHPSFTTGETTEYQVAIDYVAERKEEEVGGEEIFADLTFRGTCTSRIRTGNFKKTFFVSKCRSVTDGKTGEVITDRGAIVAWLHQIIAQQQEAERDAIMRGERDGLLAEALGRDVIVEYPTLSTGKVDQFRVTIDSMSRWNGTIRFHGKARRAGTAGKRAWTGDKSFYLRDIISMVDPKEGPVIDMEDYLLALARLGPIK